MAYIAKFRNIKFSLSIGEKKLTLSGFELVLRAKRVDLKRENDMAELNLAGVAVSVDEVQ